jgi:hypothetical protein
LATSLCIQCIQRHTLEVPEIMWAATSLEPDRKRDNTRVDGGMRPTDLEEDSWLPSRLIPQNSSYRNPFYVHYCT